MIASKLLKLNDIGVVELKFGFKNDLSTKKIIVDSGSLDFSFKIQRHHLEKNRKRILFNLKTKSSDIPVQFSIDVFLDYSFEEEIENKKEMQFEISNIIPQAISFCRGYLFSFFQNAPFRINIPFVNVIDSLNEKSIENKIEVRKSKKRSVDESRKKVEKKKTQIGKARK